VTVGFNVTGGSASVTSSSARSTSGLTATTLAVSWPLRPGTVTLIACRSCGSRKCFVVTIQERPAAASASRITPDAVRRPPASRSLRSWTVDGRMRRMTRSRGETAVDAHAALRSETATRAGSPFTVPSIHRRRCDRKNGLFQGLNAASGPGV
jgi:hypothetical protein